MVVQRRVLIKEIIGGAVAAPCMRWPLLQDSYLSICTYFELSLCPFNLLCAIGAT